MVGLKPIAKRRFCRLKPLSFVSEFIIASGYTKPFRISPQKMFTDGISLITCLLLSDSFSSDFAAIYLRFRRFRPETVFILHNSDIAWADDVLSSWEIAFACIPPIQIGVDFCLFVCITADGLGMCKHR